MPTQNTNNTRVITGLAKKGENRQKQFTNSNINNNDKPKPENTLNRGFNNSATTNLLTRNKGFGNPYRNNNTDKKEPEKEPSVDQDSDEDEERRRNERRFVDEGESSDEAVMRVWGWDEGLMRS